MEQKIIQGDCLEVMRGLPDKSFDLVLTDPPYGMTAIEWDKVLDLKIMWEEIKRISKKDATFVFTASQPFTTDLINSNRKDFKYCLVWDKVNKYTGAFNAKKRPMKSHEDIVIFQTGSPEYNPQYRKGVPYTVTRPKGKGAIYGGSGKSKKLESSTGETAHPGSIVRISGQTHKSFHPTQKPVALFEWLVASYSNEGDMILDPFMGGGTTLIAAQNLGREVVGIEVAEEYCEIARNRLAPREEKQ